MAALVDTNILVYRYDARFPDKQQIATSLLRKGLAEDSICISHQTVIEFIAAVTRSPQGEPAILSLDEARQEAEELLLQFPILYPNEEIVRLALRGVSAYSLSWFDAHMWAYAEHFGLNVLWSEDFQHRRLYGRVRVLNPFVSETGASAGG